ncbi:hypothetical protein [Chitinivibrio alkaliphilus]|uniref:Uncharacterized protein n=1 Tax=Chitinivibrio alkaliphilus ACht1 TaxID=1313304 RepID=U7D6X0_9BACT|nr:hypothetical protein [Chitinivibrio alkaliphilus]ERP31316.1 hypothetical protein CALK_1805 [Chitinivibrio alkaliphilus ACht1]
MEQNEIKNSYWDVILNLIEKTLEEDKNNIKGVISKFKLLIDFAIAPQQLSHVENAPYPDPEELKKLHGLRFYYVSDWIIEIIDIFTMVEEKRDILDNLRHLKTALAEIEDKIKERQQERYDYLRGVIDFSSEGAYLARRVLMSLPRVDDVRYTAIYKNEKTASGTYFNVNEKKSLPVNVFG